MLLTELKELLKKGEKIIHRLPHTANGIDHREKLFMMVDGKEEEMSMTVLSDLGDFVKEVETKDQTIIHHIHKKKSSKVEDVVDTSNAPEIKPPKKKKKSKK